MNLFFRIRQSIAWALLSGFIGLGLISTFVFPPFQVPDEPQHWATFLYMFDSSFGTNHSYDGRYSGLSTHFAADKIAHRRGRRMPTGRFGSVEGASDVRPPSAGYVKYVHLLSYPGALLAAAIPHPDESKSGIYLFYLSRLIGGMLIALIMGRFIYLMGKSQFEPINQCLTILAICLSPLFIQQSFALSADVVCHAFFVSSFVLFLLPEKAQGIDKFIFTLTGILACTTKPYFLPIFPLVVLSSGLMGRPFIRRAGWLNWVCPIIFVLLVVMWMRMQDSIHYIQNYSRLDPTAQLRWVMSHPLQATKVLLMAAEGVLVNMKLMADRLGWLDTSLAKGFFEMWMAILWVCLAINIFSFYGKPSKELFIKGFVFIAAGFATGLACLLSLFVVYTPTGSSAVSSVQGRYFFISSAFILVGGQHLISAVISFSRERLHISNRVKYFEPHTAMSKFVYVASVGTFIVGILIYCCYFFMTLAQRYW